MDFSARHVLTQLHGWVLGILLIAGVIFVLIALASLTARNAPAPSPDDERFIGRAAWCTAGTAWLAVLSGSYIIYPWYRAKPPPGTADLSAYPRSLLLASHDTAWLHDVGMEWKEHVAWLTPIALTMSAAVFTRYGSKLGQHRAARHAVLSFIVVSLVATAVAGNFGLMLMHIAPLRSVPAPQLVGDAR